MSNTYSNLLFHVVFSTKERRPFMSDMVRDRLYAYMGGIVRDCGGIMYRIGGTDDHVHLLVRWNTTDGVAALVRDVKSRSSAWIHETWPQARHFAWQTGYGAFSVSHSLKEQVVTYIDKQLAHHAHIDFKAEFVEMLKLNEIEYDERYLWD